MTVGELITLLSQRDTDLRVVTQDRSDNPSMWDVVAVSWDVQLYKHGEKIEKVVVIQ